MYFPLLANYLPPDSIGISSEPHRNLIGISPNDERIIKQRSPYHLLKIQRLRFGMFPKMQSGGNKIKVGVIRFI